MSLILNNLSIDGISATIPLDLGIVVDRLNRHLGTSQRPAVPVKGRGYDHALALVERATEQTVALVMYGHRHEHPHVYAIGTESYNSPAVYAALRASFPGQFLPSRIDAAWDFDDPAAFDRLWIFMQSEALRRNLAIDQHGDWVRGVARTFYIGARSSVLMIRVYEYNAHHGFGPPCRLELEIKPKKAAQRLQVASLEPFELLTLSASVRAYMDHLGIANTAFRLHAGPRAPATIERDTAFIANTAYPALSRIIEAHLGDIEAAVLSVIAYRQQRADVLALRERLVTCNTLAESQHGVTPHESAIAH